MQQCYVGSVNEKLIGSRFTYIIIRGAPIVKMVEGHLPALNKALQ